MFTNAIKLIVVLTICSQTMCQFFGSRQNLPYGGNHLQTIPAWGGIGASQTRGGPLQANVGASDPSISGPNGGSINLGVQTTFGRGRKPQHQIDLQGRVIF